MRKQNLLLVLLLVAGSALADDEVGIGPWQLGMSKEQVVAFSDFAPYEDVAATGAVTTGKAKFAGHEVDASFAFGASGLRSVQIRAYQGKDWRKASQSALEVFDLFAARHGGADVKELSDNIDRKQLETILERTLGTAEEIHKRYARNGNAVIVTFDMVPRRQPAGSRLHCQWVYMGKSDTYSVYLYQDQPGAPARDAPDNIQQEKL